MPAATNNKARLVNEYTTIYLGDVQRQGRDYPIFIKALRRNLAALGGSKRFEIAPTKTYTTSAGLAQKYTRDSKGVIWVHTSGKTNQQGNNTIYNNERAVNPEIGGVPLSLLVKRVVGARSSDKAKKPTPRKDGRVNRSKPVGGTFGKSSQLNKSVTLKVPPNMTLAEVGEVVAKLKKTSNVEGWKYGSFTENFTIPKSSGGSRSSSATNLAVKYYVPLAKYTAQKLNTDGAVSKTNGSNKDKGLVVATMGEKALGLLGLSSIAQSEVADIKKGSAYSATNNNAIGSGRMLSQYSVFTKMKGYSSIWVDTGSLSTNKTPLTPGTGISVKVRFTSNKVLSGQVSIASRKTPIGKKSSYAFFQVPSGTPTAIIHRALAAMPKIARSFQVSTDGKNYGNSFSLGVRGSNFGNGDANA